MRRLPWDGEVNRLRAVVLAPVAGHYFEVFEINLAVAIDVAGDLEFTGRFSEVGFARLESTAVGSYIYYAAVGVRLFSN